MNLINPVSVKRANYIYVGYTYYNDINVKFKNMPNNYRWLRDSYI